MGQNRSESILSHCSGGDKFHAMFQFHLKKTLYNYKKKQIEAEWKPTWKKVKMFLREG